MYNPLSRQTEHEKLIDVLQASGLQAINDEFGIDAGFDERRDLASKLAKLETIFEEMRATEIKVAELEAKITLLDQN